MMTNDQVEAEVHYDPNMDDIVSVKCGTGEPDPEILTDEIDECDFSDGVEFIPQENADAEASTDAGVLDRNFQSVHSDHLYTNTWYYPMIIKKDGKDGLWRRRYIYHKSMSFGYNNFKRDNKDNQSGKYFRMMFVQHRDFDANIRDRQHVKPGLQYQLVSERIANPATKMSSSGNWSADLIEYIITHYFNSRVEWRYTMNPKKENNTGDYYTKRIGNDNAAWIPEVGNHKFSWGGGWCTGMRLKSASSNAPGWLNTQENGDDIFSSNHFTDNYIVFADDKRVGRDFVIRG
ncbi:hypothetical protein BGW38_001347, partial [Lunasporangiospora selenospora]